LKIPPRENGTKQQVTFEIVFKKPDNPFDRVSVFVIGFGSLTHIDHFLHSGDLSNKDFAEKNRWLDQILGMILDTELTTERPEISKPQSKLARKEVITPPPSEFRKKVTALLERAQRGSGHLIDNVPEDRLREVGLAIIAKNKGQSNLGHTVTLEEFGIKL